MQEPEAVDELVEATGVDVRSVSIIWTEEEPFPDVTFSGCSAFEAMGFLRAALRKLDREFQLPLDDEGDDEDVD